MDDITSYYAPPIHLLPANPAAASGVLSSTSICRYSYKSCTTSICHLRPPTRNSSNDQLRTLFVAGLPEDVKPREIFYLFREFPGYQSSNLRSPTSSNSQPFAFATFLDQQSAVMALHALRGMVFDLEKGSTLYMTLRNLILGQSATAQMTRDKVQKRD